MKLEAQLIKQFSYKKMYEYAKKMYEFKNAIYTMAASASN